MQPTPENIKMAQAVAKAIEPHVYPYYDNDERHQLDILSLTDPADRNVGIYFTIGLSDHQNRVEVRGGQQNTIIHNKELRAYYLRRVGEGKSKMSTINVLRNKILARMFALINRQSGYVELAKYAA